MTEKLDGLDITKAYKQVSWHQYPAGDPIPKIAVSLNAWGIFPKGKRSHELFFSSSGEDYWIRPLHGYITNEVHVPKEKVQQWIKSLPVVNWKPMPVPDELWPEAKRLAEAVDADHEILILGKPPEKPVEKATQKPKQENLYWYSIIELKKMCQDKGLSIEGSKETLIRRLK